MEFILVCSLFALYGAVWRWYVALAYSSVMVYNEHINKLAQVKGECGSDGEVYY